MDYAKIDTSKLRHDPRMPNFLDSFRDIPEFNPRKWDFRFMRETVLRYIVLMYDRNCELWSRIPNYWQRKRVAAQAAGFTITASGPRKGMFMEDVEKMLLGMYEPINQMIIRYCLFFNDVEYLTLVSYMELFIQETMRVMETSSDTKDTKAIIGNIDSLNQKIRDLTVHVLGGQETLDVRKELYKSVISEILKIRPELVATGLQSREPPVSPVYEYK